MEQRCTLFSCKICWSDGGKCPTARAAPPLPPPHPPAGMGQGRSRMLDLLELVTSATPAEPQLGRDAHPEVRRMMQVRWRGWGAGRGLCPACGLLAGGTVLPPSATCSCSTHGAVLLTAPLPAAPPPPPPKPTHQALELDGLLAGGALVPQGGVRAVSQRGVGLYDVVALKDELLRRWVVVFLACCWASSAGCGSICCGCLGAALVGPAGHLPAQLLILYSAAPPRLNTPLQVQRVGGAARRSIGGAQGGVPVRLAV